MKYLQPYKIYERKNNYQLFHSTIALREILEEGFIVAGGHDDDYDWWNVELRRNVITNWKEDKFVSISATRNLNYLGLPALELDVEKISDKYKILPYIENIDYYLDFDENKLKKTDNKNLKNFQNMLRSKSKNAGKEFWKIKTNKDEIDFGINEEIILTDKLDVSKYVKRIILEKSSRYNENKSIIDLINKKYPHIDVVEINATSGNYNYSSVKKELKNREEVKNKKPVLSERKDNL